MPEPNPELQGPPAPGRTRLITRTKDKEVLTAARETDARTAITRGLREYMEQLTVEFPGGRSRRLLRVLESWGEPEVPTAFPSAVVYAGEDGNYEASDFTPQTVYVAASPLRQPGFTIRKVAEFAIPLTVEVWCTDPVERMQLVGMLEDAFDPVEWQSGFVLELPHYHGARALFEKTSSRYVDTAEKSMQRWRNAVFQLTGTVAQYRLSGPVSVFQPQVAVEDVVE